MNANEDRSGAHGSRWLSGLVRTRRFARVAGGVAAALVGAAALTALGWWLTSSSRLAVTKSVPGLDGAPVGGGGRTGRVNVGEFFLAGEGEVRARPRSGEWPRFRGPGFNGVAPRGVKLADRWPSAGPKELWSVDLGEGYAGAAVSGGRVYVLDFDESRGADALRCLSLDDGKEIWRRWYRAPVKRNHGFSRTIPAVADGYVLTIGPEGHVMCVDAQNGELKWGVDLRAEYGAEIPLWHAGQCALIDRGTAVIGVGAEVLLVGIDCETGEVRWSTPNPRGYRMSHSSIIPMTLQGSASYVYCAVGAVVGVSAEEGSAGKLLWEVREWNPRVVAPSPVQLGEGRIFVTAGYGAGAALLQVELGTTGFEGAVVARWNPRQGFASEQQTPVLYRGHLYGAIPKDGGDAAGELVCANPEGEILWRSGKERRVGLGPYLVADEKIYALSDEGILTMARATPDRYQELGRASVLSGRDAWAPMCLAGSLLIVRDSRRMVCLELGG